MAGTQIALTSLANQINEQHRLAEQAARTAIEHAWNAGKLLSEAKEQVAHGQWITWVQDNCEVGIRQAQKYMRLATALPKANSDSHLSIDKALETMAQPQLRGPDVVEPGDWHYYANDPRAQIQVWVWPYDTDHFHYSMLTSSYEDGPSFLSASKGPVRWDWMDKIVPFMSEAEKIDEKPLMGIVLRHFCFNDLLHRARRRAKSLMDEKKRNIPETDTPMLAGVWSNYASQSRADFWLSHKNEFRFSYY